MNAKVPGDDTTLRALDESFPAIPEVKIVAEIGRGGMGTVYRGQQQFVQRDVAVKVLKSELGSDYTRRFHREARLLARMSHPAIVACLSAGHTDDGLSYIVMELIDGPDLYHWLQDHGQLETREALQLTLSLARALAYAYEQGIIHRDIKTANVLLAPRPGAAEHDLFPFDAKLADLGLARPQDLDGQSSMAVTAAGVSMGTPSCMAPEQFDAPDKIDFRADIYGLGCVLFHCLTGRAAFPKQGLSQVLTTKMNPIAPNPRAVLPELPHPVAHLVSKMLATHRDERHRDYGELMSEIEGLLRAPAAPAAVFPWTRVLVGVAVVAAALFGAWQLQGEGDVSDGPSGSGQTAGRSGDHAASPTNAPLDDEGSDLSALALRWPLEQRGQQPATTLGYPAGSAVSLAVFSPESLDGPPTHVAWTLFQAPDSARPALEGQLADLGSASMGDLLLPRVAGLESYPLVINVQPRQGDGPQGFETFTLNVDSTRDVRSITQPSVLMNGQELLGWEPRAGSSASFREAEDYPGVQGNSAGIGDEATAATFALPQGDWQVTGAFRAFCSGKTWFTEVGLWLDCAPGKTRMLVIKALSPDPGQPVAYELSTVEFKPDETLLLGEEPHTGTKSHGLFHRPWQRDDGKSSSREVEFTLRKQGTELSITATGQESGRLVTVLEAEPSTLGIFVAGGVGDFRDFRIAPLD